MAILFIPVSLYKNDQKFSAMAIVIFSINVTTKDGDIV